MKLLEKKLQPAIEEQRHCNDERFHFPFFLFTFTLFFVIFIVEGFVGREIASGQREAESLRR